LSENFPAQFAGLRAGSLVAGYRLEAQVGAGGMAVVFRARDERLGRPVALKVLAPALASDPGFRRRFIAESRAAAAVDDPHIIPIYEAGESDGALFIAMRFVAGGDLRQVLAREGALSPGRAAGFLSPVASALDAAHRAGLVHRDVKPANILVDARRDRPDHVYLSDFGVSKGAMSSVSLTGAGQFLGTPDYSAPEQIQGLTVDGRADQYALACVAFQLLTGRLPFERDQGMAVLFAHLSEPPPSLARRRPGLPASADLVLIKGMAKAPEKRFGSCADFADALREALGLSPYASSDPDRLPPRITSEQGFSRSTTAPTVDWLPNDAGAASQVAPAWLSGGPTRSRAASPPQRLPGHARDRSRSRRRWLVPMAVATAIVAIVAAVLVKVAGSGSTPEGLAYAEGGRVPPYYVWIISKGNSAANPSYAVVRLTATGAVLGTIKATASSGTILAVTGAADDRTFVLDEQTWTSPNSPNILSTDAALRPRTFELLHLSADGKPGPVTRLPITEPAGALVSGLALSPDGTKLAVAVRPDAANSDLTEVKLYSVATGAVLQTWASAGDIGFESDDPEELTWTSDQRTLAFLWAGSGASLRPQGEWLLDLSLGGGNLLHDSRQVTSLSNSASGLACHQDSIITPDGSSIVCGGTNALAHSLESGFLEYASASGKLTRILAHSTLRNADSPLADVLWSNPSGSVLICAIPSAGNVKVAMITAGRVTPLDGAWFQGRLDQGAW
jgi:serine/threonine protein kinase